VNALLPGRDPLRAEVVPGRPATVVVRRRPDPAAWVGEHREELDALVRRHGAVLIAGLPVTRPSAVAAVRGAFGLPAAGWRERFAAGRELADGVWSAPEWPADREQCLHHDEGYGVEFPLLLLIACLTPANSGGAMLLGDTRAALDALPAGLVARFRAEGWRFDRTFRPHFGPSWSEAFGVDEPAAVEKVCAERLIGFQWLPDGVLRLTRRRSAVVSHPVTGDECWFNDVGFFSRWSVDTTERNLLLSAFGERGLPFDTWFGDGGAIDEAAWRSILDAYDAVTVRLPWRAGDLLLLDNLLTAHGREPYAGPWQLAVAPADPVPLTACRPTVTPSS
jgi:alpha-ketoglutarate-dependent taurine dioxygenase